VWVLVSCVFHFAEPPHGVMSRRRRRYCGAGPVGVGHIVLPRAAFDLYESLFLFVSSPALPLSPLVGMALL